MAQLYFYVAVTRPLVAGQRDSSQFLDVGIRWEGKRDIAGRCDDSAAGTGDEAEVTARSGDAVFNNSRESDPQDLRKQNSSMDPGG
jgi:hypothetical protein